jgi:hypothetical protein
MSAVMYKTWFTYITKIVEISFLISLDKHCPCIFSRHIGNPGPDKLAGICAFSSFMTILLTELADDSRLLQAIASYMPLFATGVTRSCKRTLNARVRAISLVMTTLSTVEAFASQFLRLGTRTRIMSSFTTATKCDQYITPRYL